jgi:hypothetical protein
MAASGRLEPDNHRPGSDRNRRTSPVAESPDQGPLTKPAADARPRGRGLLFLVESECGAVAVGRA